METTLALWALFFILFLGVVWITVLDRLQRVEKLLKELRSSEDRHNTRRGG